MPATEARIRICPDGRAPATRLRLGLSLFDCLVTSNLASRPTFMNTSCDQSLSGKLNGAAPSLIFRSARSYALQLTILVGETIEKREKAIEKAEGQLTTRRAVRPETSPDAAVFLYCFGFPWMTPCRSPERRYWNFQKVFH